MSSNNSGHRTILRFVVLASLVLGTLGLSQYTAAGAGTDWYASVGGTGDCSHAAPCASIDAAYQRAGSGDTIFMAPGTYGAQTVNYRAAANAFAANVVVRPLTGGVTIADRLSVHGPHLTVQGISLTGFSEIVSDPGGNANFSRFENIDSTNQVFVTGSDNTAVVNSHIHPGINSVGITVTPYNTGSHNPANVLIENNEVGPTWATPDWQTLGLHNSSIHVLGAANLTIRQNLIWEGATSSSLEIGPDMGPISGLLIENNYIAGCALRTPPVGTVCVAYYAIGVSNYPGVSPSEIIIRNNTVRGDIVDYNFVRSRLSLTAASAAVISGNVVDGRVGCSGATMRANLLRADSFWDCSFNILTTPLFGDPIVGGISWGTLNGLTGILPGVPAGAGFTTVASVAPTTTLAPTTTTAATITVAPTTTVPGPAGRFGATTPGPAYDQAGSGYKYGSVYSVGQSASLTDFRFFAKGGSTGQAFVPAIYRVDTGGHPTTLAAQGPAVTVASGQAAGWVTAPLPATTLAPGMYLLALISAPNSRGAMVAYSVETNGGLWNANSSTTPSSSWGTLNPEPYRWSFQVDYR